MEDIIEKCSFSSSEKSWEDGYRYFFIHRNIVKKLTTFTAFSKEINRVFSELELMMFCNLPEKFAEKFWFKGEYFSTVFTLHMFVMMFVWVHFILLDSRFKTDSSQHSDLTKEFYGPKDTRSRNLRKVCFQIPRGEDMKLLHLLKNTDSLWSYIFFMFLNDFFYFHNWDWVSIKVFEIYEKGKGCQKIFWKKDIFLYYNMEYY